ncbi:NAD(P)H-binding protein [Jannaschia sp.]|nr:NAD(P)H-binding protein [Jannaschia sp.]
MTTILVLGGYGLIGAACARALAADGMRVIGFGRSAETFARVLPGLPYRIGDLRAMDADAWAVALDGIDVVVNAAGALQDSARDDLRAVHVTALQGLTQAIGHRRLIQISAVGVAPEASTAFLRTKAAGDALVRDGASDWVILRPGLVVGPAAYGGTALLRAAAALPVIPGVFPTAPIQCVALADLAEAVVLCARGSVASGTTADLVEPAPRPLPHVTVAMRQWLGLRPARVVPVPDWAVALIGRGADALAALGWRSPLRSTALDVLRGGVTGDATRWPHPLRSLDQMLAAMPATVQERWFARLWPLVPVAVAVLSVFWLLLSV